MNKSINIPFVLLVIVGFVFIESCVSSDPCDSIVCENGRICIDGICECPEDFVGVNCENFDATKIQILLNDHTPFELFNGGILLDSLYGKKYMDGLIFYLDTINGMGMVAAEEDQAHEAEWDYCGADIAGLNNVLTFPDGITAETDEGARIGDGLTNTNLILAECNAAGSAAYLCRDLGED